MPYCGPRNSTPAITPRLLIAGANAGSKKCWWALSTPITRPLTPKRMGASSRTRSRAAARKICPGSSKPGAMMFGSSHGARAKPIAAKPVNPRKTRLPTEDARRQAAGRLSVASTPVNIGTEAEEERRQAHRGEVGVEFGAGAEGRQHHHQAHQAGQAGDEEAEHHHTGGA